MFNILYFDFVEKGACRKECLIATIEPLRRKGHLTPNTLL